VLHACTPQGLSSTSLMERATSATALSAQVRAVSAEMLRARVTMPQEQADSRWTWALLALGAAALLLEWRVRA
jgi:hypothetical protein